MNGFTIDDFRFTRAMVLLAALFAAGGALSGCVSKSAEKANEQKAYVAGQQAAAQQQLQQQIQQLKQQLAQESTAGGWQVAVVGFGKVRLLPWTNELTLSSAIVQAQYKGPDPTSIVIHQTDGQDIPFDPRRLLNGEDLLLQAGDIVEIQ